MRMRLGGSGRHRSAHQEPVQRRVRRRRLLEHDGESVARFSVTAFAVSQLHSVTMAYCALTSSCAPGTLANATANDTAPAGTGAWMPRRLRAGTLVADRPVWLK